MVSDKPGITPQANGYLNHTRFWAATVLVDHYYGYYYAHHMRVKSSEEALWAKEAYEYLADTRKSRVYAYRGDRGRFTDNQFK